MIGSRVILNQSMTAGTTVNANLVGIEKLKYVAYAKKPAPTARPVVGKTRENPKVLLK